MQHSQVQPLYFCANFTQIYVSKGVMLELNVYCSLCGGFLLDNLVSEDEACFAVATQTTAGRVQDS